VTAHKSSRSARRPAHGYSCFPQIRLGPTAAEGSLTLQQRFDCAVLTRRPAGVSLPGSRVASDVLRARRRSSQASKSHARYFTDLPNFRYSGPPPALRIFARVEADNNR
jgi:hypothetical protein